MLSRGVWRHRPFLIVVSSPSGAGKTSLCREVVRQDKNIVYSVSATTRHPRKGEVHGRHYFFWTEREFKARLARGGFLEHAIVYGHFYGTPKTPLLGQLRKGKDVLADLDIQGMRSCRKALPDSVAIFITTQSQKELMRRLHSRGTDSAREINRRQSELKSELAAIPEFDYIVVNDRLKDTARRILSIIRAERLRTYRLHPGRKAKRSIVNEVSVD
ncbi:guanylate kinase [candidate division WOR-3 bacterium JGI_Cruoil_03_51_56]|uniref:Guanylate kinase n=1 Tax=candidate division WOR-3 bacterium JGI_Cruoil_03_51_56 TaxID=1973747 RepID=A0A235BXT3_UNCW3|nr:MAG: guanylate kinase [candidate division WOR-3 bacterium JGI_Cruoil_03_51_56]